MSVIIAAEAGFCMGVARAVRLTQDAMGRGEKLQSLGRLIHSPQMIARLEAKGLTSIPSLDEALPGRKVVIRAHGASREVYDRLEREGLEYIDATCPYVAKIHRIVRRESSGGAGVIILGDENHPEVIGILGHCQGEAVVVKDACEFSKLCLERQNCVEKPYILVSQTTASLCEWKKCEDKAKKEWTSLVLFGTMCKATESRQNKAEAVARRVDAMVVVGGRGSANTASLARLCSEFVPTAWVEQAGELTQDFFEGKRQVGITAGASTPAFIIKEVQLRMSEILSTGEEMSFEEMLEQSFRTVRSRERVKAEVTSVSPTELAVDIGTKHAGYVPLAEFTDDPAAKLEDLVKPGDTLELIVLRVNDVEGTVMLSKKRLDSAAGFEKIVAAGENGDVLEGRVVDVIKGGVVVLYQGIRVFIPASQATLSRGEPLEPLNKTMVNFKILETNRQRKRAVGSIRVALKDERDKLVEGFWQDVEIGRNYTGTVRSLTSYGAFVDIGGVDGMVHVSELSWSRIGSPADVVSVGQQLNVYIKDIDREKRKISLGYKDPAENPWELLRTKYSTGDTAKVKIVSMTPFGAFAQVIPGVEGLIHISQISAERIAKPGDALEIGQELDAKITDIDFDRCRVSLSLRALIEAEQQSSDEQPPVVMEFGPPQE